MMQRYSNLTRRALFFRTVRECNGAPRGYLGTYVVIETTLS